MISFVMTAIAALIPSRTTCIVGGGSSAHVLIPFLSNAGHRVHLLTRRPSEWHDVIYCNMTDGATGQVTQSLMGTLDKKSDHPRDVIPEADVVILCLPVHQYRAALDRLAPFLNRNKDEVFVGTIYGQGGFNWMAHSIEKEHHLDNLVIFAVGSIPWICRTLKYGHSAANYGGKDINLVAIRPLNKFDKLNDVLLQDLSVHPLHCGAFKEASTFLSLTLSVDNQILHPARCFGLYQSSGGSWASDVHVPYFYRDFDKHSADIVKRIDDDYTAVRNAVRKHFPDRSYTYMLNYTDLERLNHPSGKGDIIESVCDSHQLASIKTPTIVQPDGSRTIDTNTRFFTDDIPYGLLIAKSLGEKLHVSTPMIERVITWAQDLRGEKFLDDHGNINNEFCLRDKYTSGIPESYGLSKLKDLLE